MLVIWSNGKKCLNTNYLDESEMFHESGNPATVSVQMNLDT